jgi:hypothetical protein
MYYDTPRALFRIVADTEKKKSRGLSDAVARCFIILTLHRIRYGKPQIQESSRHNGSPHSTLRIAFAHIFLDNKRTLFSGLVFILSHPHLRLYI